MCGIVGLHGSDLNYNSNTKRDFVRKGLDISKWRGTDSTGIALLLKDNQNPQVFKRALVSSDFIRLDTFTNILGNLYESHGVIGHTRSKTQGGINDNNAHPFQYGHITLVHNGSINNGNALLEYHQRLKSPPTVDSALIAHALSVEEPEVILPKIIGAFSLVWWDNRNNSLHFARNDERPMWWAFAQDKKMLYYASQKNFLDILTSECGISTLDNALYSTKTYTHYIFKNTQNMTEYDSVPFPGPSKHNNHTGAGKGKKKQAGYPRTETKGLLPFVQSPTQSYNNTGIEEVTTGSTRGSLPAKTAAYGPSKHPCDSESIPASLATCVHEAISDGKKLQRCIELCADVGILFDSTISVQPVSWRAYSGNAERGIMLTSHIQTKSLVQIFDVTRVAWEVHALRPRLPIRVKAHRGSWDPLLTGDERIAPVFVGVIEASLLSQRIFSPAERGSLQQSEKEDGPNYDEGHKTDYIEVGPAPRRWVAPDVYLELVSAGCINCSRSMDIKDAKGTYWLDSSDGAVLCPDCASKSEIILEWEKANHAAVH